MWLDSLYAAILNWCAFRCVLLLPGVVFLMRSATNRHVHRCAYAQACKDPSRQVPPWGQRAISLAKHHPFLPLPFRVRPISAACCLGLHSWTLSIDPTPLPNHLQPPLLLCSATMDPLRDPLHDLVLEEALADTGPAPASTVAAGVAEATTDGAAEAAGADDASEASGEGSVHSTLTAALEAADRSPSPSRRGPGPYGPVPMSHPLARQYIPTLIPAGPPALPVGFLGHIQGHRRAASTPAGSSSSARGPPTVPQMPGEPDDPHWQRVLAVNALNTLQHTGPAFVHAPTLARSAANEWTHRTWTTPCI